MGFLGGFRCGGALVAAVLGDPRLPNGRPIGLGLDVIKDGVHVTEDGKKEVNDRAKNEENEKD